MWLFARRLTGDGWAAATSAVLFAFCPFLFSHTAHIQLLMAAGLPLSLLMIHRLADAPSPGAAPRSAWRLPRRRWPAPTTASLPASWLPTRRCSWPGRAGCGGAALLAAVAVGAVMSIVLVAPFFAHYLQLQSETGFGRSLQDATPYSAYLRSYLASAAHAHNWMLSIIKDWNHEVLFPGFVAIVLAALGIGGAARRPGAPERRLSGDRETLSLYGSLACWRSGRRSVRAPGSTRCCSRLSRCSRCCAPRAHRHSRRPGSGAVRGLRRSRAETAIPGPCRGGRCALLRGRAPRSEWHPDRLARVASRSRRPTTCSPACRVARSRSFRSTNGASTSTCIPSTW